MKRPVSPLVGILSVVLALSVAITAIWVAQPATGAPSGSLDELSNQQLVSALEHTSASNIDRRLQVAQRLWQQRGAIPRKDVLSVITDQTRSQMSRELMLDILADKPGEAIATNDVRALLLDRRLNSSLKARILADYRFDRADASLLTSLASSPDGLIAFHALKRLGKTDSVAACELASEALSATNHSSDAKLSAAYKVLVRSGTLEADEARRSSLLRHLASTVSDEDSSPELLDSATFALSEMRSLDALRIVLESTRVDRALIIGAIDENAGVIKRALEQNPDEFTIELAVTAMELYPVKEMAEPLGAARGRVQSHALRSRLSHVSAHIEREGASINPRSTEKSGRR